MRIKRQLTPEFGVDTNKKATTSSKKAGENETLPTEDQGLDFAVVENADVEYDEQNQDYEVGTGYDFACNNSSVNDNEANLLVRTVGNLNLNSHLTSSSLDK
jgi:hypothetical protein